MDRKEGQAVQQNTADAKENSGAAEELKAQAEQMKAAVTTLSGLWIAGASAGRLRPAGILANPGSTSPASISTGNGRRQSAH